MLYHLHVFYKKNFTFVYKVLYTGLYRRRACRVPDTLGAGAHIPKHTSSVAMSRTRTRAIIYPLFYNKPDNKNVGLVAKKRKSKMKNTYTWHVVANKLLINLFPLKPQMGLVFFAVTKASIEQWPQEFKLRSSLLRCETASPYGRAERKQTSGAYVEPPKVGTVCTNC